LNFFFFPESLWGTPVPFGMLLSSQLSCLYLLLRPPGPPPPFQGNPLDSPSLNTGFPAFCLTPIYGIIHVSGQVSLLMFFFFFPPRWCILGDVPTSDVSSPLNAFLTTDVGHSFFFGEFLIQIHPFWFIFPGAPQQGLQEKNSLSSGWNDVWLEDYLYLMSSSPHRLFSHSSFS